MEKTEKDEFLINKIKGGDRKSEEFLYDKYRKIITRYIVNKYPFNYETDDDVSDILIKIFENIDKFDINKSKFNTWVINLTTNHMIDKSRSTNYWNTLNTDSLNADDSGKITFTTTTDNVSTIFSVTPTSLFNSDNVEINDSLDFIENKIGMQDFHLLNMKYKEGYDYNEMAKEMRTSSHTLSNRISYIKNKLKKGKN